MMNKIFSYPLLKWLKSALYAWIRIVGTIVTLILCIIFLLNMRSNVPTLPKTAILKLDLGGVFHENEDIDFLSQVQSGNRRMLYDVCHLIKEASKEENIQGIFVHLTPLSISFAQIQELQEALQEFKKTGKKIYVYTANFPSTKEYYLASLFDEISTLSIGEVGIAGFRLERYFVRGLLDKWAVHPNMQHQGKYKSFAETYTEKDFSSTNKEATLSMLSTMENYVMKDIQTWRKIGDVHSLFEQGDLQADEALKEKLITRIIDLSAFEKEILDHYGKEAKFFMAKDYDRILDDRSKPKNIKKYVALLSMTGEIEDDRKGGGRHPLEDGMMIRPAKVIKELKELMKDEKIVAVVLRLDSPGGSPTASEEIWTQIKEFSKKKPVIASIGSVGASGGYYIASACSKIVAQPLSLTGSIGVVGGKFNTSGFWENLGVHWGEIYTMKSALLHSTNHDYSPSQKDRIEKNMKHVYEVFKQRVAEGRNLTLEQVEAVAQGRVWSGLQAKEHKLIDELGGISKAFELVKKELKLEGEEKIDLYVYTFGLGLQDLIMRLLGFDTEEDDVEDDFSVIDYFKGVYISCMGLFSKTQRLNVEG